ncbi:hypothetical protein CQW23_23867 [Capsicum baccatum]|uniref:RNA-polymerase II-associated protein 3-like C-terminal domain-containing protein n=1 Tax=Capsicum baccatum TaxID=33114 RepID=A0A2G2VT65_CAPBA|nr:hypothetical protein CQW23_23867 [Capsicum baccatum]
MIWTDIALRKTQQELDESVQELAARAADLAKTEAAKNIAAPNSAYQFEVSWRGLSGDRNLQTHLLKITSPAMLPRIFKNALSASMLMDILRCVATFFIEDMNLAIRYLEDLTKVPRFDMIIMCLSSTDKSELLKMWEEVFCKGAGGHTATLGALCFNPDSIIETVVCIHLTDMPDTKLTGVQPVTPARRVSVSRHWLLRLLSTEITEITELLRLLRFPESHDCLSSMDHSLTEEIVKT